MQLSQSRLYVSSTFPGSSYVIFNTGFSNSENGGRSQVIKLDTVTKNIVIIPETFFFLLFHYCTSAGQGVLSFG